MALIWWLIMATENLGLSHITSAFFNGYKISVYFCTLAHKKQLRLALQDIPYCRSIFRFWPVELSGRKLWPFDVFKDSDSGLADGAKPIHFTCHLTPREGPLPAVLDSAQTGTNEWTVRNVNWRGGLSFGTTDLRPA